MWFFIEHFRILENFERHFFSSQKNIFSWSWKKNLDKALKQKIEICWLRTVSDRFRHSNGTNNRRIKNGPKITGFLEEKVLSIDKPYTRPQIGTHLLSCRRISIWVFYRVSKIRQRFSSAWNNPFAIFRVIVIYRKLQYVSD